VYRDRIRRQKTNMKFKKFLSDRRKTFIVKVKFLFDRRKTFIVTVIKYWN